FIMDIANRHNLYVVEDCAEAHGATFKGKKVGSFGHINTFSFFANKIITTGEGGICLTNDKELNDRMRVLRDHGMNKNRRYWHDVVGYNYRMTNMQAAVGCAQMERVDDIIAYRDKLEESYKEILKDLDFIQIQPKLKHRRKTVWLASALIEEDKRQGFIDFYKSHNIDIRPFFFPLSEMDLYKEYSFSYKVSHRLSKTGISFPTHKNVHLDKFRKVTEMYLSEVYSRV
ncbi:MAG: DegT/DnrJ/EryC1/StrS family aminotransferase, partial [Chitinophagales bacterium]